MVQKITSAELKQRRDEIMREIANPKSRRRIADLQAALRLIGSEIERLEGKKAPSIIYVKTSKGLD